MNINNDRPPGLRVPGSRRINVLPLDRTPAVWLPTECAAQDPLLVQEQIRLQHEIATLQQQIATTNALIQQHHAQIKLAGDALQAAQKEAQQAKAEARNAERVKLQTTSALSQANADLNRCTKEIDAVRTECATQLQKVEQELEHFKRLYREQLAKPRESAESLKALDANIKATQEAFESWKREKETLQEENAALKKQADDVSQARKALETACADKDAELQRSAQEVQALRKQNTEKDARIIELEAELKTQISTYQRRVDMLEAQVKQTQTSGEKDAKIAQQNTEINDLKERVNRRNARITELQGHLAKWNAAAARAIAAEATQALELKHAAKAAEAALKEEDVPQFLTQIVETRRQSLAELKSTQTELEQTKDELLKCKTNLSECKQQLDAKSEEVTSLVTYIRETSQVIDAAGNWVTQQPPMKPRGGAEGYALALEKMILHLKSLLDTRTTELKKCTKELAVRTGLSLTAAQTKRVELYNTQAKCVELATELARVQGTAGREQSKLQEAYDQCQTDAAALQQELNAEEETEVQDRTEAKQTRERVIELETEVKQLQGTVQEHSRTVTEKDELIQALQQAAQESTARTKALEASEAEEKRKALEAEATLVAERNANADALAKKDQELAKAAESSCAVSEERDQRLTELQGAIDYVNNWTAELRKTIRFPYNMFYPPRLVVPKSMVDATSRVHSVVQTLYDEIIKEKANAVDAETNLQRVTKQLADVNQLNKTCKEQLQKLTSENDAIEKAVVKLSQEKKACDKLTLNQAAVIEQLKLENKRLEKTVLEYQQEQTEREQTVHGKQVPRRSGWSIFSRAASTDPEQLLRECETKLAELQGVKEDLEHEVAVAKENTEQSVREAEHLAKLKSQGELATKDTQIHMMGLQIKDLETQYQTKQREANVEKLYRELTETQKKVALFATQADTVNKAIQEYESAYNPQGGLRLSASQMEPLWRAVVDSLRSANNAYLAKYIEYLERRYEYAVEHARWEHAIGTTVNKYRNTRPAQEFADTVLDTYKYNSADLTARVKTKLDQDLKIPPPKFNPPRLAWQMEAGLEIKPDTKENVELQKKRLYDIKTGTERLTTIAVEILGKETYESLLQTIARQIPKAKLPEPPRKLNTPFDLKQISIVWNVFEDSMRTWFDNKYNDLNAYHEHQAYLRSRINQELLDKALQTVGRDYIRNQHNINTQAFLNAVKEWYKTPPPGVLDTVKAQVENEPTLFTRKMDRAFNVPADKVIDDALLEALAAVSTQSAETTPETKQLLQYRETVQSMEKELKDCQQKLIARPPLVAAKLSAMRRSEPREK